MTVEEMLKRISSRELSEWAEFEKEYGPIGTSYRDSLLREIHHMQQQQLFHFGGANTGKGKQNPIPKPEYFPAPHEYYKKLKEQKDKDQEE